MVCSDADLKSKLSSAGTVRIITNTILSPSTQLSLDQFAEKFGAEIDYDPISNFGISSAAKTTYVWRAFLVIIMMANVIVSFGADFLGTWISPIEQEAIQQRKKDFKEKAGHVPSLSV